MAQDYLFQGMGVTTASFLVEVDGVPVGRFTECHGLQVEVEVEEYQEGGVNGHAHKLPGRMSWPNIVLKRGLTYDNDLFDWFNKAAGTSFAAEGRVQREPVGITLISRTGARLRTWTLMEALPVRWSGPSLVSSEDDVPTEELEVAHHGFEAETFHS